MRRPGNRSMPPSWGAQRNAPAAQRSGHAPAMDRTAAHSWLDTAREGDSSSSCAGICGRHSPGPARITAPGSRWLQSIRIVALAGSNEPPLDRLCNWPC